MTDIRPIIISYSYGGGEGGGGENSYRADAVLQTTYLDSRTNAMTPARSGAEALVPVKDVVHRPWAVVDTYRHKARGCTMYTNAHHRL